MELISDVGKCIIGKKLLGEAEIIRPIKAEAIIFKHRWVLDNRYVGRTAFCRIEIIVKQDYTKLLKKWFRQYLPEVNLRISEQKGKSLYGKHIYCECRKKPKIKKICAKRRFTRGLFRGNAWAYISRLYKESKRYKPTERVYH